MDYNIVVCEYFALYVCENDSARYRIRYFPVDSVYIADFIDYNNRDNDQYQEFTSWYLADQFIRRLHNA